MKQAADYYQVSPTLIRRIIAHQQLDARRIGRSPNIRIERESLQLLRWRIWFSSQPQQRSTFYPDQTTERHDPATDTDAADLQISQHLVVDLCAVNPAVLRYLADGQPLGKFHCLILGSDGLADHRKLPLPLLCSGADDPLCGPVVDA
jgi:hypothetical protein